MPLISIFGGIRITMYFDDHNPPHFHADYSGHRAVIRILDAAVDNGALPSKQLKIVLAWCVIYQEELMEDWELVKQGQAPKKIPALY